MRMTRKVTTVLGVALLCYTALWGVACLTLIVDNLPPVDPPQPVYRAGDRARVTWGLHRDQCVTILDGAYDEGAGTWSYIVETDHGITTAKARHLVPVADGPKPAPDPVPDDVGGDLFGPEPSWLRPGPRLHVVPLAPGDRDPLRLQSGGGA